MIRRRLRGWRDGVCGLTVLSVCVLAATAADPDEKALWQLWEQHAEPPHDHAALLAACQAFTADHEDDPLAAVSRTLAGWHLLQLGRRDEAVAVFEGSADAGPDPLPSGGGEVAKAWLSRLDREEVKEALQFYYRKNVAYPRRMDDLLAYPQLPKSLAFRERDRWRRRWGYRLTGFKTMRGLLDQKYELQSYRLGAGSDLADALTVPCGSLVNIEPVQIKSSVLPGQEIVEMRRLSDGGTEEDGDDETLVIAAVGTWVDNVHLAYVGRYIVIVNDHYHWKVFPKPGVR